MNIGVAQTGGTNIGVAQYETATTTATGFMTCNKGFWAMLLGLFLG
jgi:hypothetical protein